ncbi:hypothetical protein VAEU17_4290002 [Vibrio aestuarianus]|nr:hypothetical protein VAEU17_4290002 [Vibrio aestuarianus]
MTTLIDQCLRNMAYHTDYLVTSHNALFSALIFFALKRKNTIRPLFLYPKILCISGIAAI